MAGYVPHTIIDYSANPNVTGGFWEAAARAGVESIVIDAAMAWDRPTIDGARVLAGLGVPDARGQNGDWFIYTDDPAESAAAPKGRGTSTAGTVFRVDEEDGRIVSAIYGPPNFWERDRLARELAEVEEGVADTSKGYEAIETLRTRLAELEKEARAARDEHMQLPLAVERADGKAKITIGDATQELAAGEWSSWYRLTFEVNPLIKAHAIARVKVVSLADPFELFVGILQIDPENPSFWQPISQPASFASELAEMIGEPYETVGWACLSMPYKDAEIDEETFLEDIQFTQAWREKLTLACLERDDWRLLMSVESTPDRVQHMLYKYWDPEHPMHDPAAAAREVRFYGETIPLSEVIPATYRQLDRFVGDVVQKHLRPDDTLILCADHGFQPFRRQVHVNNWLARNGYLALKPGVRSSDRNYLAFIDWSKTRAYSLALGMVYLNLAGREANGIVDPADAPALIEEIKAGLAAMQDEDGTPAMAEVYTTADVHQGPYLDLEADLMTGFARGYRVSWSTTLGGIRLEKGEDGGYVAASPFEDNTNPWSGGHVSVARSLVRGIFFCNRPLELPQDGVDLLHVAPTALEALGVAVPAEYDRPALRFR
jgi:predicted AlkP superfamily phosphohydrolase/phosphomutase